MSGDRRNVMIVTSMDAVQGMHASEFSVFNKSSMLAFFIPVECVWRCQEDA